LTGTSKKGGNSHLSKLKRTAVLGSQANVANGSIKRVHRISYQRPMSGANSYQQKNKPKTCKRENCSQQLRRIDCTKKRGGSMFAVAAIIARTPWILPLSRSWLKINK